MSRLLSKQARFNPAGISADTAERTNGDGYRVPLKRDFTGGENKNILPEMVAPNEAITLQNCVLRTDGLPETREGKTLLNTESLGAGKVTSIHRFAKENGDKFLIVQHMTELYAVEWDGSATIATFGTEIGTGYDLAKFRSEVWKDTLWLTNGVDSPIKITEAAGVFTVAAIGGSPPAYPYIKVYGGRLWLIGGNIIRFSDLEDGETWDALNIIKVRDGDGDEITGFSPQDGGVVIFKNNSAWPMYGTSLVDLRIGTDPLKFTSGSAQIITGCIAPDSILDDGIFLGIDNFYQFNLLGGQSFKPTHMELLATYPLADRRLAFSVSDTLRKRAIVTVPGYGTFCIDGKFNGAITSWTNINASCYCVSNAKDDPFKLLIGDATNGKIFINSGDTDDGTDIPTFIKTAYEEYGSSGEKVFRFYNPEIEAVYLQDVTMIYAQSDVDYQRLSVLQQSTDFSDVNLLDWGIDDWGAATWGSTERVSPVFWFQLRGFRCSHELTIAGRIRYLGHKTKLIETGYQ